MDSCPRLAARLYVSPRERVLTPEEAETRRLAYALRGGDPEAVRLAAREMASLLPLGIELVPVPSSSCDLTANLLLAEAVAELVRGRVVLALGRLFPVESSRLRRLRGAPPLPVSERGFFATAAPKAPAPGPSDVKALSGQPALVDNVTVSGLTFLAARFALGSGFGIAFAIHTVRARLRGVNP